VIIVTFRDPAGAAPPGNRNVGQILLAGQEPDPHVVASPHEVAVYPVLALTKDAAVLVYLIV
jgi:hypothetical protein